MGKNETVIGFLCRERALCTIISTAKQESVRPLYAIWHEGGRVCYTPSYMYDLLDEYICRLYTNFLVSAIFSKKVLIFLPNVPFSKFLTNPLLRIQILWESPLKCL